MSKKSLRVAAILMSVCFVLTMAPVLNSAEKRPIKFNVMSVLKQPLALLASMLHIPPAVLEDFAQIKNQKEVINRDSNIPGIVKPTGDGVITPPAGKD